MGIDLLNKLKFLFQDRFKTDSDEVKFDDIAESKANTPEIENNGFELKLIKYLNETTENKEDEAEESENERESESEDEDDVESIQTQASARKAESESDIESDIHYQVVDINDIIEAGDNKKEVDMIQLAQSEENPAGEPNSISIVEDIPFTVENNLLDNIIMDSISDDLVGDANVLPNDGQIQNQEYSQISSVNSELMTKIVKNNNEDLVNGTRESQNSESSNSNSDNFVFINNSSSSESSSLVEIKKSSIEMDVQEKTLVNNENGSPKENLIQEENSDEPNKNI